MKRKKGGKRCVDGSRAAGRADAMARIERWQAEASGEVAERLAALGEAVVAGRLVRSQQLRQSQQLRRDW